MDDLGEHFGVVRSGKAARKEEHQRGETSATGGQREAIKAEADWKDKESKQVSKQTSKQESETQRPRHPWGSFGAVRSRKAARRRTPERRDERHRRAKGSHKVRGGQERQGMQASKQASK